MAKSLTAIMELVRTVGSLDFWRIVKNSWRCDAQNSELKKGRPHRRLQSKQNQRFSYLTNINLPSVIAAAA